MSSNSADILLVTVTEVEGKAVLKVFEEATGKKAIQIIIDSRHYFKLGAIHGAAVAMTQCEMGAGGLNASLITVQKAIDALSPSAVIMVGIAFGMDESKQSIGDILVAENLRPYELQRVGKKKTISRTDRVPASQSLRDRMKNANLLWEGATVRLGTLLTGEKLVDNITFRERLRRFDPEAIGGEMEGAGLYVACQNQGVDWILVKAICDWADGKKGRTKLPASRSLQRTRLRSLRMRFSLLFRGLVQRELSATRLCQSNLSSSGARRSWPASLKRSCRNRALGAS
jgi:nucleoside phosphorylase